MPRYFFNVAYGGSETDTEGFVFDDICAAQKAALRMAGEMIKEIDGKFWDAPDWRLEIMNNERALVFTLIFSAEMN